MSDSAENSMKSFNEKLIDEYRATGGKVTGDFAGAPLLLLTTIGSKSGLPRTVPIVYGTDGDEIYVIASMAGAPKDPAWFNNLVAHPEVTVELGEQTFTATAVVVDRGERDRLYAEQVAVMPGFADYEKKTTRVIPVIKLIRAV